MKEIKDTYSSIETSIRSVLHHEGIITTEQYHNYLKRANKFHKPKKKEVIDERE